MTMVAYADGVVSEPRLIQTDPWWETFSKNSENKAIKAGTVSSLTVIASFRLGVLECVKYEQNTQFTIPIVSTPRFSPPNRRNTTLDEVLKRGGSEHK